MSADPGPPPINAPMQDANGRITPIWALWLVAFYNYVKGLA